MRILGCMSGSSLDGLDLALCHFNNEFDFELIKHTCIPYSKSWENKLASSTKLSHQEICLLESEYSFYISNLIRDFIHDDEPDYISSHGHTLLHSPEQRYTYQLAEGSYMAAQIGIPVISDFRQQDMAKGGQGAPIAPVVEKYLFSGYDSYLNLGGICNCSFHLDNSIIAYDIGPCNQLLNALAKLVGKSYDHDGEMAKSAKVIKPLFDHAKSHPFYSKDFPKSLDNQFVQSEFVKEFVDYNATVEDKLRTAVELIVHIIVSEYGKQISSVFVTGGGALNKFLISRLQDSLSAKNVELVVPSKEIVECKEAILMALMGYLRVQKKINVFSSVTGATSDTVAGCIYI